MGAAEDHRVHAGRVQRRAGALDAVATVRSSTSPPAWISVASSAEATACSSTCGRRLGEGALVGAALHRGRGGDQADPALAGDAAARRDSGRTTPMTAPAPELLAQRGSAAAVAELQATTSSLAPRSIRMSASSREKRAAHPAERPP